MIVQSMSNGYQWARETAETIYKGFGISSSGSVSDQHGARLNQTSCALRATLPAFLLLSNVVFRGRPSYLGTTLGTAVLIGTACFSDKLGNKNDPAIFGLQAGTSLFLLSSSLSQLGSTGLPFYLSLATAVANGAIFAASAKAGSELNEEAHKATSGLHALFPIVWGGLMLSSQSSYGWVPAASALAQPLILGLGLLADFKLKDSYSDKMSLSSSFAWLCLGASLIGTVTSFLSGVRASSDWLSSATYGAAIGLNLATSGALCFAAHMVGKVTDEAAKAAKSETK